MGILDEIVAYKQQTVANQKKVFSKGLLSKSHFYHRSSDSLVASIKTRAYSVIAEFKRRSPSKGEINSDAKILDVVWDYSKAGVSGISVLTDTHFFGGSLEDLVHAKNIASVPILRKDFIIDSYQIHESKAFGADVVLLIARILDAQQIKDFSQSAHSLGMEVLLEIHHQNELDNIDLSHIDLIGVNNRNLRTFEVSTQRSIRLVQSIPNSFIKIAESGIHSAEEILKLKSLGFDGFLIGEYFMKSNDPGQTAQQLIHALDS